MVSESKPLTIVSTLPIIHGSPTEWDNLNTAVKEADKLRQEICPDSKTIISFDLQRYAKSIALQVRSDVRDNYVFRMGELHVVFCVLKVLGKMTDGRGLDRAFEEAGEFDKFFLFLIFQIDCILYFRRYCSGHPNFEVFNFLISN